MTARLIAAAEMRWHPCELAGTEIVPETWTGAHVARRLSEAYRTLFRIPAQFGPRVFGSMWPEYAHEWTDLLAQQEQVDDEKRRAARAQNRTRIMPSAEEISRMERALYWPARYLQLTPHLLRATQYAAIAVALDRDFRWVARKHGGHPDTWRARSWHGRAVIAAGLVGDRVPVF